jgi:hypothetical protein
MSDLYRTAPAPLDVYGQPVSPESARSVDLADFCESVARLNGHVAHRLRIALGQLVASNRLHPPEHHALLRYVSALNDTSQASQQIIRLQRGRVRRSQEAVDVEEMLRNAVAERADQWRQSGIQLRMHGSGASVSVEPTLLYSLIDAMLHWASLNGKQVQCRLDVNYVQSSVGLVVKAFRSSAVHGDLSLTCSDVTWHLITQLAASTGTLVDRISDHHGGVLSAQIGPLVNEFEGLSTVEMDESSLSSATMVGKVVLVLSESQAFRARIRDALRDSSFEVETVGSIAQLRDAIFYKTPGSIVVDHACITPEFEEVRQQLLLDMGTFAFVEVFDEKQGSMISGMDTDRFARMSLSDVDKALMPVLSFEIAKSS